MLTHRLWVIARLEYFIRRLRAGRVQEQNGAYRDGGRDGSPDRLTSRSSLDIQWSAISLRTLLKVSCSETLYW